MFGALTNPRQKHLAGGKRGNRAKRITKMLA